MPSLSPFSWFERRLPPYPAAEPVLPPTGFLPFVWRMTAGARGYFVGMAANVLPVPGGIGAVDGGMIAALVGFGVPAGPALVGVLSYRALAFWLPIVPGAVAYVQLLRDRPGSAATT